MPRKRRQDFPTFKQEDGEVERLLKNLPRIIKNMQLNFFDDSFQREGWIDTGFRPWTPRKHKDGNEQQRGRRGLLKQSGDLRRSIKAAIRGNVITFYSDLPYAEVHNEGFQGKQQVPTHTRTSRRGKSYTVKAHTRRQNIPKRQFMGYSETLDKRLETQINKSMDEIFGD